MFWVRQGTCWALGLSKHCWSSSNIQAASQQRGAQFQLFGIGGRNLANGFQIFFQTSAIETGLHQILRRAHESSRLSPDCGAQEC